MGFPFRGLDEVRKLHHGTCCRPRLPPQPRDGEVPFIRWAQRIVEMDTVYIETSIVSYLRQRPSTQIVAAARQLLTHRWWDNERKNYELVISQYVIDEAAAGNPILAAERLELLEGIPLLPHTPEITTLSLIHI